MTFNPNDYLSSNESIILSGTVNIGYINTKEIVKFVLTNKKVITAGDDHLQIIPLNQINHISGSNNQIGIHTSDGTANVCFYYVGNPTWYNEIIQEISKRIG